MGAAGVRLRPLPVLRARAAGDGPEGHQARDPLPGQRRRRDADRPHREEDRAHSGSRTPGSSWASRWTSSRSSTRTRPSAPRSSPASGREDIKAWMKGVKDLLRLLHRPRYMQANLPEFQQKDSRDYFIGGHPVPPFDKPEWKAADFPA